MTNAIRKLLSFLLVAVMMLSLVAPALPELKVSAARSETKSATGDDLTVGILSDIHVSDTFGEGVQLNRLKKALRFFKTQNVEAVVIAGDLQEFTSAETSDQQKMYMGQIVSAWQEIFPAAKGEEGYVEPIFIYGNHDTGLSESGWWPEELGTFSPAYTKEVNGYTFVAAHHFRNPSQKYGPEQAAPLLEDAVDANPNKPVFYIQHSWIGDTVPGYGYGDGEAAAGRSMLSNYSNVVAFTGHTHVPLTDELSIWQGDEGNEAQFTVVNCGTTNYVGDLGDGLHCNEKVQAGNQAQFGMVMQVSGSVISIDRFSFTDMTDDATSGAEKIGETWAWDACDVTDRPYAYDTRYAAANAPAFPQNAAITVDSVTDNSVTVTVPAATISDVAGYSDMVARYVVEACNPTTGEVEAWGQIASEYHIDDKTDVRFSDSYTVSVTGLKPGVNYTLKAYAVEFFGKRSQPITADITATGECSWYRTGDVNLDGNIDEADMTALQEILAVPADYNAVADIDSNGINETRDITALQAIQDAAVVTYPESGDLIDRVAKVELTKVSTSDNYQPVAYGTRIETGVVNGDSNQAIKTWTTNYAGYPVTTVCFDEPVDLSGYTHLSFDALFENEYTVASAYQKRYLYVSLISGEQNQLGAVGALNFDSSAKGWDTKSISLAGVKNVDLTAVTGIRFGHNFDYYDGRFDGATEHAIYIDNLIPLYVEGSDSDMLTTSTVTGGQNVYGAGYTNHTNVAVSSTGGTLDVVWASEKVLNDYAAFTVDMRTPVKTTVTVQPIDAAGNLLGSPVTAESCYIYQNKDIETVGFAVADDVIAAGLRFTYTCGSLLLDNMNVRGAKDFDLIGTASDIVKASPSDKSTLVLTTEGTNDSNNALYVYATPGSSVWGGGAKLVYDEPLDLSVNHYLRFDIKLTNAHRDLYLKLFDADGNNILANIGTKYIHQSYGSDGLGAYATYEIDLLAIEDVTAEQLKAVYAIQFAFNLESKASYGNAVNDDSAYRQAWIDNVYAVNPMEDMNGAAGPMSGLTESKLQEGFVYQVEPEKYGYKNVLYWYSDPNNSGGTTDNWLGSAKTAIVPSVVKLNTYTYNSNYDYFQFKLKNEGTHNDITLNLLDAGGNILGTTGTWRITLQSDWVTYRLGLEEMGLTAEEIPQIAQVSVSFNWQYQNVNNATLKVAEICIADMGFGSFTADSVDLLEQVDTISVESCDYWPSYPNSYPASGWMFQSDVITRPGEAFMFYRNDWSATSFGSGWEPRQRMLMLKNPVTLTADDVLSIEVINENFRTHSDVSMMLYGSDGKLYTCFVFDKTGSYYLETNVADLVSTDGVAFDPATVNIVGMRFNIRYSPNSAIDTTKPGYLVLDNFIVGAWEPTAEEQAERDSDIFSIATPNWQNPWNTAGTGLNMEWDSTETTGTDSLRSWSFGAVGDVSSQTTTMQLDLNKVYNMTNSYLVFDAKVISDNNVPVTFSMRTRGEYNGSTVDICGPQGVTVEGDWKTYKVDFDAWIWQGTNDAIKSLVFAFTFGTDTGNRTLYIDNVRLVAKETAQQDMIHTSTGTSTAVKEVNFDYIRAEGSSQSMRLSSTGKVNATWTLNTSTLTDIPVLDSGVLGGFFYFGANKPWAAVKLTNSASAVTSQIPLIFANAGDGWYFGYVDAAAAAELGDNKTIHILQLILLPETVYVDGLLKYAQLPTGLTAITQIDDDLLYNATNDSGALQSTVTNGSDLAVKLVPSDPGHQWHYVTTTLNQNVDITNKKLMVDIKVVGATSPTVNISTLNGKWTNENSGSNLRQTLSADKWVTVSFDLEAVFAETVSLAGVTSINKLGFNVGAYNRTEDFAIYMDNLRIIRKETVAEDWTNMPINSGSTHGTVSVSNEHIYGDSSQSLKYEPSGKKYMALNPVTALNNGAIQALPDFTAGTLSWYAYFGDQTPWTKISTAGDGWGYSSSNPVVEYVSVGDGWYKAEVDVSTITGSESYNASQIICIYLYADVTVWFDQMTFTPPVSTATVETEAASDMVYGAYISAGTFSSARPFLSYDNQCTDMVYGPDSLYSFKLAYDGTENDNHDNWPYITLNYDSKSYNLTNKKLVFEVYIDCEVAAQTISISQLMDKSWNAINSASMGASVTAGQWTTVEFNMSDVVLKDGYTLDAVHLIRFQMAFTKGVAETIYIDNFRIEATEASEAASDLTYSYYISGGNFTGSTHNSYDKQCTELVYGDDSLYSLKLAYDGTEETDHNTWPYVWFNFDSEVDFTGKKIVFDIYIDCEVASQSIGIYRLLDKGWNVISTSTKSASFTARQWTTVEFDMADFTVAEGKSLTGMSLFGIQMTFENGVAETIYIDNVRLVDTDA